MNAVPISELEVKLIARSLFVKAASALQVKYAWLLENSELKECLQQRNSELALLIEKYVDALWSCHFALKTKKSNVTQADTDRYTELVNRKNLLRNQVIDFLPLSDSVTE
ncbi:hypothetical protein [Spirosoma linguale]|uniref:Uncharacterized protein n=1 Tax=Spirosoma linguale (strain ATCC 33905 / DSM 74 / LMG 10896 / Claus 1) TaxID=504472 RepID=D2QVB4_SPILD|nr:hypothetical protein Slin_6796 [Spirosoma linguale DSM 74]